MIKRLDHFLVGFAAGTVLPFIGFWITYLVVIYANNLSWKRFWNMFNTSAEHRAEVLTLSLIANMFAFYLFFFRWKLDRASRGLVAVTLAMGAYIVYLRIF
jgi:hypothetical protein